MCHVDTSLARWVLVRILTVLLAAAFVPALAGLALAAPVQQTVFGPQVFTRIPGPQQSFDATFSVADPTVPHVLRVKNGDRLRQNRLSEVTVEVNGVPLVLREDLDRSVAIVVRPITLLRATNKLEIVMQGTASGFVTVDVYSAAANVANNPPVANAGIDLFVSVGDTVQLDGSASFDPDNDPITYDWDLPSRPAGSNATLLNPTSVAPSFVADVAGMYVVTLVVSDAVSSSDPPDRGRVVVTQPTTVTVPNVVGLSQAAAQSALLGVDLSIGAVDASQHPTVPLGDVSAQNPAPGTVVSPGTPVDLTVSLGPPVDITPPDVQVTATPPIVAIGGNVALAVSATDDTGVASLSLEVNGVNVPLDGSGNATYVPATSGLFTAVATATDLGGLASSATALFKARASVDNGPPTVALTSPAEDAILEVETDLVGTASDTDLAMYEMQAARAGTGSFVTFATGYTSVVAGTLARLNPGAFTPGIYDLRVCATDSWGNQACSNVRRVEVSSERSLPGLLKLAFLDGFVDVVGMPISVRRIYDAGQKTVGDFGVGWRLDSQAVKLETTRQMGVDWQIVKVGTIVPTFFLVASKDHRVNAFLPDGTVHRFRMRPDPSSQQIFPIDFLNGAFFDALPGTTSTLTPNDQPCCVLPVLNNNGPVEIFDFNIEIYNPTAYSLRLVDGRVLSFVQSGSPLSFRLASVTDNNGNVVTIGPGGISHSAGVGVSMVRDGQGRITSLTNPDGETRTYTYDARGDLVTATDFEGNATQFRYDLNHNLVQVIDPRGFTPGTLIYNENGQIVAMIDSEGNRVDISYDDSTNQQFVTDRLGHTTISTYDDAGNLISFVDALGNQSTATYDADGHLLTQTDPLGHTQSYTYDAEGRLLTYTDAMGSTSLRAYDAAGRLTLMTDALGNTTPIAYDASGNVAQFTVPGGGTYQFQHGSNGALSQVTQPDGGVLGIASDGAGRVTSFTDPLGRMRNVAYDDVGQLTSLDFTYGGQAVHYGYAYDANSRITQAAFPDGSTGQLDYDAAGFPATTTSTLGARQQMLYDAEGHLVSLSNHGDAVTSFERDAEDRFTAAVTPGGLRVERVLDPLGRPVTTTNPDGTQVSVQYDAGGRIVAQQRSGEGQFTFDHDDNGNVTQVTAPDGGVIASTYDALGRRTAVTDPLGATTQFQYDPAGRPTHTTLPGGAIVKNEYDSSGRLTAIEDPVGSRIEYVYDVAGQITSTLDTAGATTSFAYDELGGLSGATTPAGNTWSFGYNLKGQRTSQTYPWGGTQTYDLDAYGRATKITDPTGSFGTFQYDAASRLVSRAQSTGEQELRTYDGVGRVVSIATTNGVTSFAYGSDTTLDRVDYPDGSFVEYTFDAGGRVASVRTPGGTTSYAYDSQSRLTSVQDSALGTTTYTYDLAGRVSVVAMPDGSSTALSRDVRGAVTDIDTSVGGNTLRDSTFAYDVAGKLLAATEIGRSVTYGYDTAGRVVSEVRVGSDAGSVPYAYDGNWSLTQIGARTLAYDGAMRLTSDGAFTQYTYDAGGRPVSRSNGSVTELFTYDALGHLVRVDRSGALPATVALEYDHAGLLSRIDVDGVGRRLLWDSAQPIARLLEERTDAGALIRRHVHGIGPIGVFDGAGHVLHRDPNGNVRLITDLAGNVEAQYAFSAYGAQTLGGTNLTSSLRYGSELLVPELGFYFLRSRFYDPVAGRFLTPDVLPPMQVAPQTFNPYLYANANPLAFRDPLGTFSMGEVQISISIASILAGIAFQHFIEPLAMVINAFTPTPPSVAYPVGVTASFGVTGTAPGTGVLGASMGLSGTVLTNLSKSLLTISLNLGASISLPTPAALANAPSFSVSAGIVFGEMFGPPSVPPSIGYSLDISGTIAEKVMMWYVKSITPGTIGGVPVAATTLAGGQEFATGSAGLSLNLQPPDGASLWDAFTITVSPNGVASAPYLSTMVNVLEPGWSGFGSSNILPATAWTLGITFSVSIPLAYVAWDGEQITSGLVGTDFDLW